MSKSTRSLLGVKGDQRARLKTSPSSESPLSRECGSLDFSQVLAFDYNNVQLTKLG
jgi:hypothetical protein